MLRPDHGETEAFFPRPDVAEGPPEDDLVDRHAVIAAARRQRLRDPGLAVDRETLERIADAFADTDRVAFESPHPAGLPGLYYTPEEAADEFPDEVRDRVLEYAERNADVIGGVRFGWRDGRRMAFVGVVEDLESHNEALTAIGGDRVLVEPAVRSERDLHALQDRVFGDAEELRALGISLASGWPKPSDGIVELSIVSADAEQAARILSERYGPAVQVGRCVASWWAEVPRAFGSWSAEGRMLAVFYPLDINGEKTGRCDVVELPDSVICTVTVREPVVGLSTRVAGYRRTSADVELREPLGTREVIDGSCGEARPSLTQLRAS
ncbi:MAG TPA: hypothetical protein VG165_02620 [Solirubrobacteraceae bacterium]|nr:hypothetical protein [Solirubrobacteraceae bacterium]